MKINRESENYDNQNSNNIILKGKTKLNKHLSPINDDNKGIYSNIINNSSGSSFQ